MLNPFRVLRFLRSFFRMFHIRLLLFHPYQGDFEPVNDNPEGIE